MYFLEKLKAIELRRKGLSYKEIRNSISVSKATLSKWLKDIELTDEQKSRLSRLQATAYLGAKKIQAASIAHHNNIREAAKKEVPFLIKDSFFACGLMLYWAEGDKRSGRLQFSNSDSEMIKLMMRWFREFCKIPEEKFRISLFIHKLHVREDCLEFWRRITNVPLSQFPKPYIKPTIFSNRKNKLYEGTCVIRINSRDLLSKVLGWIDGVKEFYLAQEQ